MTGSRRYATVALSLALAASVTGAGFAEPVAQTARKLITGKRIKDGAVTSKKIRNHSLRAKDVARGVLPRGPAGGAGQPGAAGADGAGGPAGAAGAPGGSVQFVDGAGPGL